MAAQSGRRLHVTPARAARALAAMLLGGWLVACTTPPTEVPADVRSALAPTGTLRVGVYPGSPTSLVRAGDEMRGVSVEVGRALARELDVPIDFVVLARPDEVVQALKAGRADLTVTNASAARARDVDFSRPLLGIELGYLVLPGSPVSALDGVDRPGIRIGVSAGSSSQAALAQTLRQAVLVPALSLPAAAELLRSGQVDAYATNKAILNEMADGLPGARVLDGRWGLEHLAIAIPKGRDVARPYLQRFADALQGSGAVQRAADRAGLRGSVPADAR
jgi:polar amino acid transport system substrate-binding protein